MLILTRKAGEYINIGDETILKIIKVDRGVVKIGFDAPKEINIVRSEIKDKGRNGNV